MQKRWTIGPAVVALGLCLALPPFAAAVAQDSQPETPQEDSPGALARESLQQMMRALRLLVESIPQYELPEVLDNGDIIIRRKHSSEPPAEPPAEAPEFDKTAT